ncbi:hypothetical protein B566_EDAN015126 [Ephemera danica]|nr:hypothetical protein B566_EDAN015126 [Ephemera danica]
MNDRSKPIIYTLFEQPKMSSAIELLGKQAIKTFSRNSHGVLSSCFEENLKKLKNLAEKITADDVCLIKSIASSKSSKAPVTYVEIYEDTDVTMGIFILKPGSALPLHDHPMMHGILKVLAGSLTIRSYSKIDNSSLCANLLSRFAGETNVSTVAKKHVISTVSPSEGCCTLTALDHNLHEISHTSGQYAAFLDILAPPYCEDAPDEDKRECHYFQEIKEIVFQGAVLSILKEIPSPSSFWSDSAPYFGPPISH